MKNLGSFLVEEFARAEMVTNGYNMDDTGGSNDNDDNDNDGDDAYMYTYTYTYTDTDT